jgi:hypothetical protein
MLTPDLATTPPPRGYYLRLTPHSTCPLLKLLIVKSFKLKRLLQQCVMAEDFVTQLPSNYGARSLAVERVASFQVRAHSRVAS